VDVEQWHPRHRSPALRRRLLGPRGEVLVGYAGRLAPEKEVHHLRALSGLPGVRVVVIGDGPSRTRLQRQLPLASFLGYQTGEELGRTVASLDVLVHTGAHETFCQSIQEAMAAGVPVVAPAAGGPLDLVAHGVTGWLYPAGHQELLRQAVAHLVGDPDLRLRMGAEAQRRVGARTWAAVGDRLLAYYRQVIGVEGVRRAA
jgi:phosphatidylinositol alpha 1,6-mannosyltransferase